MRKPYNSPRPEQPKDDASLIQHLMGLGVLSSRKSYYPELLDKIDQLELEKERYQWLFENALHGIFQAQIDSGISEANPAIAKICGYASAIQIQDEVQDIGKQLFYLADDYQQLLEQLYQHGLCAGFETQLRKKNGQPVSVAINVLLKDPDSGLLEAFVQDITARKQAQEQLTQLNADLEQRVKYRTATLNHTNEKLNDTLKTLRNTLNTLVEKEKMAAIGELVAGVALEINAPIDASISCALLLQEAAEDISQKIQPSSLSAQEVDPSIQAISLNSQQIAANLNRVSQLVSSFKQIAAAQANEVAQPFNVAKNLRQSLMPVEHKLKQAGCEVVVECDEHLEIFSYPGSFVRIYTHLIMNSLLHGFEGMDNGLIKIQITQQGDNLTIRYQDNGRGIPETIVHKIFAPFVTTKRGLGSGLGTHIIYNQVTHLLNGTIRCQSIRGAGAMFEIKLPLTSGPITSV